MRVWVKIKIIEINVIPLIFIPKIRSKQRKRDNMKKLITILTIVCMVAGLISGVAFAADESGGSGTPATATLIVQGTPLYVAPNTEAGLDARINVASDLLGTNGTLYLPGKAATDKLCFSWDDTSVSLSKDGIIYSSGKAPIAGENESITYQVKKGTTTSTVTVKTLKGSSSVEPMFLEIDEALGTIDAMNSDENHDTQCFGSIIFDNVNKYLSIKGRGNSTWKMAKKPYNITIYEDSQYQNSKKVELVKGVKTKKWSLLANYYDNSLMRNKIAMDLAENLGIGLKTRFADLWMNGEYIGNYLITPKNDYNAPDGGYALENDNYLENEDQFQIPGMFEFAPTIPSRGYYNRISIKDIGKDAKKQGVDLSIIEEYFNEAWVALEDFDSESYQDFFDIDSWAKMFLMYEVSKTYDCYAGSLLMHRDGLTAGDKLIAGPAWDYDVSFGRMLHKFFVGVAEPVQVNAEGWYVDSIGYMIQDQPISLLQELQKHSSFMKKVSQTFNENKEAFEDTVANVDRQRELMRASALMDRHRMGPINLAAEYVVAPNTVRAIGTGNYKLNYEITTSWDNYVNNLREYCVKRVLWLSDHLAPGVDIVTFHGGTVKTDGSEIDTGMPFNDVHSGDWFFPYVKYVYDNGLFSGTSSTSFEPNTAMTRAMFVTVLWAKEGKPEGGKSGFKDLTSEWYVEAVNWAATNGIVGGYDAEHFGPDDPISRQQMISILYQYARTKGYNTKENGSLDRYKGAEDVSAYAERPMKWAVGYRILVGTEQGLEPTGISTRAQVATVIKRFDEIIVNS